MKKIEKIIDSIFNVMSFLHSHMLWFLGIPVALDALLIGAYFAFDFENFVIINSVFVVNFIGLGALALYVLWCFAVMPITIAIADAVDAFKTKKEQV
jgi:hypothetical protein